MFTTETKWEVEQQALGELYQDKRAHHLEVAIHYAREYQRHLPHIERHLPSWLTLLSHARDRSDLHESASELITLLHGPVTSLGHLTDWEPHIRFAIAVCARLGKKTQQAEFCERLSKILYWTGEFELAQEAAEQSLAIASTISDSRILVAGANAVISALIARAQLDAARTLLEAIESNSLVQETTGETRAWVMAQLLLYKAMLTRMLGGSSALVEAARLSDEAMHWLQQFPEANLNLYAHVCRNQAVYHWQIDHYGRAIKLLRQSAHLFSLQENLSDQRLAKSTLGLVYWSAGHLLKAERYIRRSAQEAKRRNGRWQFTRQIGNLALVALFRGRLLEARRYSEQHCRMAEVMGVKLEYSRARCNRGIIAFHQGEYELARTDMDFDRCYLETNYPNSQGLASTYVNLALCHAALTNSVSAHIYAKKAMQIARTVKQPSAFLIALRAMAECYPKDDHEHRIALLRRALFLAKRIGRRIDHAGCLFSLSHITNDETAWESAVALLCRAGATQWLYDDAGDKTMTNPPFLPAVV